MALTPSESADEAMRERIISEHKMGVVELATELLTDIEHERRQRGHAVRGHFHATDRLTKVAIHDATTVLASTTNEAV